LSVAFTLQLVNTNTPARNKLVIVFMCRRIKKVNFN
jgi:hypothetical protein